jgi:hypothetical protein
MLLDKVDASNSYYGQDLKVKKEKYYYITLNPFLALSLFDELILRPHKTTVGLGGGWHFTSVIVTIG